MRKAHLLLMVGLILLIAAGSALAEEATPVRGIQKVNTPPVEGGLYLKSSLVPAEVGPVELPYARPGPITKPVGGVKAATSGTPLESSGATRIGGAIPVLRGVVGSLDPVTSTDRRLKKLIGQLED